MSTILITGANGFLGSHILAELLSQKYQVVVLKRSTSNQSRIEKASGKYKSYDIDKEGLSRAFEENNIDSVIHTACIYGRKGEGSLELLESNLMFGMSILEACIKENVKAFINTDSLLPRAINSYSLSKHQFRDWLELKSGEIKVVNLRLEHLYGPGDDEVKFVNWIIGQLTKRVYEIKLTSGEQLRDFIYVEDAASAFITVLENLDLLDSFTSFDVGTGSLTDVKSFVLKLKHAYEERFGPTNTKLKFGALSYRKGDVMKPEMNTEPIKTLGWKVKYDLEHGLVRTINNIL